MPASTTSRGVPAGRRRPRPAGLLGALGLLLGGATWAMAAQPPAAGPPPPAGFEVPVRAVVTPVVVGWNGATGGHGGGFSAAAYPAVVGGEVEYVNNAALTLTLSITGSTVQTTTIPPGGQAEQPLRSVGSYVLTGSDIAGAPPGTVGRVGERARAVLTVSPRGAVGVGSPTPTGAASPGPGVDTSTRPSPAPGPGRASTATPPTGLGRAPADSAAGVAPGAGGAPVVVRATGTGLPAMHVRARGFGLPVAAAVVFLLAVLAAIVRVLLAVPAGRRH